MTARWPSSLLALLLVAGCAGEHRDWAFVQSVGGMALGTPYRTAKGLMIPVSVDVSGLRRITTEPRLMNSGLALQKVAVRREGLTLGLALMTTIASRANQQTSSGDLFLGDLEPGRYAVVYAEPNGGRVAMGEITVPPR
jgi:hypothetical protein